MGRVAVLWEQWHACNEKYFGGKLIPPESIRITRATKYDGKLHVTISEDDVVLKNCILISAHTPDPFGTLLHEMVHQYQFFVLGIDDPDHGPTFRCFAKYLERVTGAAVR